jgi:aldose 1-epimerase
MIPIGEIKAVAGTPFDFTQAKAVGKDMDKVKYGYDYCYVVNRTAPGLVLAARLYEQKSGRGLDLYTTKPGVHLYTGNHIGNVTGRDGCIYRKFDAICLETEYYPDSVNHTNFPSCLLKPGQKYEHATLYELIIR